MIRFRSSSSLRGMTFLEIMIVVVIIGVMLAVTIPNMRGPREKAALRKGSRGLAATGMLARQIALARGDKVYLRVYPERGVWRLVLPEEEKDRFSFRRDDELSSDEEFRELPDRTYFVELNQEGDILYDGSDNGLEDRQKAARERLDRDDDYLDFAFYPTGSSDAIAIQVANTRGKSMTVDFARATARPEVYRGPPKSFADKLRERGLDPAQYGVEDDGGFVDDGGFDEGEDFYRIGWDEDERVAHYEDIASRIFNRARQKYEMQEAGGPGAYYGGSAWGQ